MVWHQRPRVQAGLAVEDQGRQSLEEDLPVMVRAKDRAPFDAAHDQAMERTGIVQTWAAWHRALARNTYHDDATY
jgi:hypothetical protein